jgi:hypothetical protein
MKRTESMLQSLPNPSLAVTLKSRVAPHKTPNTSTIYNPDSTYGTLRGAPTDFDKFIGEAESKVENFLGGSKSEIPGIWTNASPSKYVNAGDPPIMLLYTRYGINVTANQSMNLKSRYEQFNLRADLIEIPAKSSPFWWNKEWEAMTMNQTLAFFTHHLRTSNKRQK